MKANKCNPQIKLFNEIMKLNTEYQKSQDTAKFSSSYTSRTD